MLDKSIREIERERQGLQTQEKKLIVEMKKNAKQGQMVCTFSIPTSMYAAEYVEKLHSKCTMVHSDLRYLMSVISSLYFHLQISLILTSLQ